MTLHSVLEFYVLCVPLRLGLSLWPFYAHFFPNVLDLHSPPAHIEFGNLNFSIPRARVVSPRGLVTESSSSSLPDSTRFFHAPWSLERIHNRSHVSPRSCRDQCTTHDNINACLSHVQQRSKSQSLSCPMDTSTHRFRGQ